ncbi:MAG: rhomboid family intramembrane serine protease [Saprospiraceae bacterium]|nr:rhomboid family intramembrane serine protease [Saprospiraceae bacterium]
MSITVALLIITGLISYNAFKDQRIIERLKHYPVAEHRNKEYYRMLSSGFVHGGWLHLLINMFVLYEFGRVVERKFQILFENEIGGSLLYLFMYLSAIIAADIPTHLQHKNNPSYAAVGASGAVSAVVFIFIMFYPFTTLALYGIIPFKAILGGIAYLVYSSWASKNRDDGIGHSAHLFGALYGILFIIVIHPTVLKEFVQQVLNYFS